ncbi:HAD family hydrolase [Armatimonas sp.]|uniref:HAD family hydrolase n=1 Tax=Armatimonas sp. TaxID=1872638 RepID=UPI003752357F
MRISFDLDDTLICYQEGVPQEKSLLSWLTREPLRLGERALIREFQKSGHSVGIYTTSYREPGMIRRWLFCYGLRPNFILTQRDNDARKVLSKDPRGFGIDWHIDNEDHVADILVLPEDSDWTKKVRTRLSGW